MATLPNQTACLEQLPVPADTTGVVATAFLASSTTSTKRPRKRTFNKNLLNDPTSSPKTGHICMLCGFLPATQNKYRELQDHLVRAHFADKIKSALPNCRPYICPEPNCAIEGKDWQALMRHYTGKHGILERYLNEIINSGFRPPPNPLNIKIGHRKSALQPAVPKHLVIKEKQSDCKPIDSDRDLDNDSGCGGDDTLSSTSSSPRSTHEATCQNGAVINITDITKPIPKEQLFTAINKGTSRSKRKKKDAPISSPQLAFVFKRPKTESEDAATDNGLTFIDVNHFLASMPAHGQMANPNVNQSPVILMPQGTVPSGAPNAGPSTIDVGQLKIADVAASNQLANLASQPVVYAQPGDMVKLCQEHLKLSGQKQGGEKTDMSTLSAVLQSDNQTRVVSTGSTQLPRMSVVPSTKAGEFSTAQPIFIAPDVQTSTADLVPLNSTTLPAQPDVGTGPALLLSQIQPSLNSPAIRSCPDGPVLAEIPQTTTATLLDTHSGLIQVSHGDIPLGSGLDLIGASADGSVIFAAPSASAAQTQPTGAFELGQTPLAQTTQSLPSLLKTEAIDQNNIMVNPENQQLIFLPNGNLFSAESLQQNAPNVAPVESECISYVACDESGNHYLIPSSMVQSSAMEVKGEVELSDILPSVSHIQPAAEISKPPEVSLTAVPVSHVGNLHLNCDQTQETIHAPGVCDSTTVDDLVATVQKEVLHSQQQSAASAVATIAEPLPRADILTVNIESGATKEGNLFADDKFNSLSRLHASAGMPIAI